MFHMFIFYTCLILTCPWPMAIAWVWVTLEHFLKSMWLLLPHPAILYLQTQHKQLTLGLPPAPRFFSGSPSEFPFLKSWKHPPFETLFLFASCLSICILFFFLSIPHIAAQSVPNFWPLLNSSFSVINLENSQAYFSKE